MQRTSVFLKPHLKKLITGACIAGLLLIAFGIYVHRISKSFFYQGKLTDAMVQEYQMVFPKGQETSLQAYVRMYFAGGKGYHALPYEGRQSLLGVYQSANGDTLILDWREGFIQSWYEKEMERDTQLFFLSLQANYPVKTVRFLMEGRLTGLMWKGHSFDDGVPMDQL